MALKKNRPLEGIKVIEFTHMVMGPTVGVMLADLGADVIKVEPIKGDNTRRLIGSGAGYFPMYNRNKKSICLDLKSGLGQKIGLKLVGRSDVFIENFRPGAMDKLGFGYDDLSQNKPDLIYCSEKGFLSGPYEQRTALDEVAQMMGGLAYMTGPPGQPLRAGASVIDVTGGMFGVIGILAALEERHRTGRGQYVKSALFETTAYLVGQHMAQYEVTGTAPQPMPARVSAWAIYDVFETADDDKVFIGVVSDTQWLNFCTIFKLETMGEDPQYSTNSERVKRRDILLPKIKAIFKTIPKDELMTKLEKAGLPFAPIARPEELIDDPHLNAEDGMITLSLSDGHKIKLPALPLEMDGKRFGLYNDLPEIGEHTSEILRLLGYSDNDIKSMAKDGVINQD